MRDPGEYRHEFPITERYTYFNHASVGPLPRRSAKAMQDLAQDVMQHGVVHYRAWSDAYQGLRSAAARLLGCQPAEIAITKNTSEGLALVANGMDWRNGDIVVGLEDEFPANYFPWLRLDRRGVKVRWLQLRGGRIELEDVDRACSGARLLAISFVQYLSGFRVDLDALGEICRRHGTILVVDGVQGLGPFPVNVKRSGIHVFAASGHKWLLGPEGCGVLSSDGGLMPHVEPTEFGWTNVAGWRTYSHEAVLRDDAARYECGTLNTIGCFGLQESLELLLEIGVEPMARRVEQLAEQIAVGAEAKGYETMTERDGQSGSGIISIRKPGVDSEAVVQRLLQNQVVVAPRAGWIRAAPHFYATEEEVQKFLDLLL